MYLHVLLLLWTANYTPKSFFLSSTVLLPPFHPVYIIAVESITFFPVFFCYIAEFQWFTQVYIILENKYHSVLGFLMQKI